MGYKWNDKLLYSREVSQSFLAAYHKILTLCKEVMVRGINLIFNATALTECIK